MVMEAAAKAPAAHLGFIEKLRVVIACVVAVLLMRTIGWRVAEPVDSQLAVTLTQSGRSIMTIWPASVVEVATAAWSLRAVPRLATWLQVPAASS